MDVQTEDVDPANLWRTTVYLYGGAGFTLLFGAMTEEITSAERWWAFGLGAILFVVAAWIAQRLPGSFLLALLLPAAGIFTSIFLLLTVYSASPAKAHLGGSGSMFSEEIVAVFDKVGRVTKGVGVVSIFALAAISIGLLLAMIVSRGQFRGND